MDKMNITLDYYCPFCDSNTKFKVSADSPTDYNCDDSCPECGAALELAFYNSLPQKIAVLLHT